DLYFLTEAGATRDIGNSPCHDYIHVHSKILNIQSYKMMSSTPHKMMHLNLVSDHAGNFEDGYTCSTHLYRPDLDTLHTSTTIAQHRHQSHDEVSNIECDDHSSQPDPPVDDSFGAEDGHLAVLAVVKIKLPAHLRVVETDAGDFAVHPDSPLGEPTCGGRELVMFESTRER
ncbi:MAG: hypothetical protein Q9192_004284, partial [Flavoplaca navasiana]